MNFNGRSSEALNFSHITAIRELDHQRKLLSTSPNQQSDEPKVLELLVACFDAKSAGLHCAVKA